MLKREWRRVMATCALTVALMGGGMGCEKSALEHLSVADSAIQKGEADRAEASIKQALSLDPELDEAKFLLVKVHMLRKQYDKAESVLDEMWKTQGLGGGKLATEQKSIKRRLKNDIYPALYRQWADSIDAKANPHKYEEVVRKGLTYDDKDRLMNQMLVDFYLARGEALIVEDKKAEAAEVFDKIYPLRTLPKTRNESQQRAKRLREEVYAAQTAERFETQHKPKLIAAERWVEGEGAVVFAVEGEYDKKMPEEQVRAMALRDVNDRMNDFVREVGALPASAKVGAAYKLEGVKVLQEEYKRGVYTLRVSAPLDTLSAYTMLVKTRADAAEEAAKKAIASGAGAPAKGAAPGSPPPGAATTPAAPTTPAGQ